MQHPVPDRSPVDAVAALGHEADDVSQPRWYRGQLHAHTYWSDGRGFPEQAVLAHLRRGYHFLCISDHNRFADQPDAWRRIAPDEGPWPPRVARAIVDRYVADFGADWVETRPGEHGEEVRLKTLAEVKAAFDQPGRFLILPGVELTQHLNGVNVHVNCINQEPPLPCIEGTALNHKVHDSPTVRELIGLNAAQTSRASAMRRTPHLLMLNHPFWRYYDIAPHDLIDAPDIRLLEICSGGSGSDHPPHPEAADYTIETFWDIVNAFRIAAGHPLLYGAGADDAHFYDAERVDGKSGVGGAWVMVRATALEPEALVAAMQRGDFYATNGVLLKEVAFRPEENTLRVEVDPVPGATYRIEFIATRRGFDTEVRHVELPSEDGRPRRALPRVTGGIGDTVQRSTGCRAEYRMKPDELYVRARVLSDIPCPPRGHFYPAVQAAWTQPVSLVSKRCKGGTDEKHPYARKPTTPHT